MPTLSPQAYCYLWHPILSSGETILQYTIQHLCITGGIRLERRRVQAHPRDPRMVSRILLSRVNRYPVATRAEAYVQELFPRGKEVSIGQLRGKIKKKKISQRDEYNLTFQALEHLNRQKTVS